MNYDIIREFKELFEIDKTSPVQPIKHTIQPFKKNRRTMQAILLGYMLIHPESRDDILGKLSDFSYWDTDFLEIVMYVQKLGNKVANRKTFKLKMKEHKLLTPAIDYNFDSCWMYRFFDKSIIDNILKDMIREDF